MSDSKPSLRRTREDRLITFAQVNTKVHYLQAFWRWVTLLAEDDYQGAIEALYWSNGTSWTAEMFKNRVVTFFGGDDAWSVIVPNDRLVGVIDESADFRARGNDEFGWFMAQIPLTTRPADPKDDEIPLMGLATSFFVRPHGE